MSNILVVENDAITREWLTEILAGHQVLTARDGREACSLVKRHDVDLVITEVSPPNEGGLGLIRSMQKDRPKIKIIVFSGAGRETLLDTKVAGAHAVLRKPATEKAVLQCVRDILVSGEQI